MPGEGTAMVDVCTHPEVSEQAYCWSRTIAAACPTGDKQPRTIRNKSYFIPK